MKHKEAVDKKDQSSNLGADETLVMNLLLLILLSVVLIAYTDSAIAKQVVIRRRRDKREDPSESFLMGEPITSISVESGFECREKCKDYSGCNSVMVRGKECVMCGQSKCYPPNTQTTAVTVPQSTEPQLPVSIKLFIFE